MEGKKSESKEQLEPSNFNFFNYLCYLVFLGLKKLGCKLNWKRMIMYDDTLDEMRMQMDINTLFQKITFYDKAIRALFEE